MFLSRNIYLFNFLNSKNFRKKKITKSYRFIFIYSKKEILVGIIDFSQTFILYEEHLRQLYEHDIVWNHFN